MSKRFSKEELRDAVTRFIQINGCVPTHHDMKSSNGYPSYSAYVRAYGSWSKALKEILQNTVVINGIEIEKDLVEAMNRFISENNSRPTQRDMVVTKGYPSSTRYITKFGTWSNAVINILGEDYKTDYYITTKFLLDELRRFYKENDRNPQKRELNASTGYPSHQVYNTRFGSFTNALIAAGLIPNRIYLDYTKCIKCEECGNEITHGATVINDKIVCKKCVYFRQYMHGTLDPNSETGISIITEHVVYIVLNDCERCNTPDTFNHHYDLISKKYGNINVKSSACYKEKSWTFGKRKPQIIPDYYICLGFNYDRTEILHVWIIPGDSDVVANYGINVSKSRINRLKNYEVNADEYNIIYKNLDINSFLEFKNFGR